MCEGFQSFWQDRENELFSNEPHQINFLPDITRQNWSEHVRSANQGFLDTLTGRANVYAFFVRNKGTQASWQVKYVGESKRLDLKTRLTAHLIFKSQKTGAKFADVQKAVLEDGQEIAVALIMVNPESLRLAVEEEIIQKHQPEWNTHGCKRTLERH